MRTRMRLLAGVALAGTIGLAGVGVGVASAGQGVPEPKNPTAAVPEAAAVAAVGRARALALVSYNGTVVRVKGGITVTKMGTGMYCIKLPSTIPAGGIVPAVTPDWSTSPDVDVNVQWVSSDSCVGNATAVYTFNGAGLADEGFTIVIP